ncbi:hypothetical protein AvCA_37200 [Azotobacter vinelandii CA]|uniref:Uncharacterized protein n=2 Tax=Azotobacter vinelandii TaxID=354 RepID=C1DRZ0_AZOVD|nr:hypothetical protein [Azotobacter vinelandii]ACO79865.1 conserved hypothetical protein [Azotobacter vinelandii DJ]AGK16185.1 hypothetical protein AvCA_37200 [Azotobacter vinelandii CA]AGK21561.1 hypothetical protein AvCA6_37200 [Azotobacter vinelandii CA6]SFX43975.1 hypothetical protein SAMN04244547_01578 [Azotobacter vinelandii]GLK62328.1 hypothetical protein GCM10017624_44920 [Azotobacter vinelandii]
MENAVVIRLSLEPKQAEALLLHLREQFRQGLQARWYADRYRLVPDAARSGAILHDCPCLAAQKKALGALRAALDQAQ